MLTRTHVAFSLFLGILLFKFSENPAIFFISLIVATFIPDLDSFNSKFGKRFFSRVLTAFTKHRGIMHSLLFLFMVYTFLYFYFPIVSFGFLIGYGGHLVGDLITKQGLRIFYPFKFRIHGFLKTGGRLESFVSLILVILDFVLIIKISFFHFFLN